MNVHSRAGKKFQKVVKLSENAKRCPSPGRTAHFTRRSPSNRDRLHPRFTLVLIRARYYQPTTGEFTSQDPMEYVDGMSLYRGYFVLGGVDPLGEQTRDRRRDRHRGYRTRNRWRGFNASLFDDRGLEILDHWLSGSGRPFVKYGGLWGEYMINNKLLTPQLSPKLLADCKSRTASGELKIPSFSAVIENGYSTGYEMLHGTNAFVGGFEMGGRAEVWTDPDGNTVIDYKNVDYTWNDIIDANDEYGSDILFEWGLRWFYKPADYNIHIHWSEPARCVKDCNGKIIKTSGYPFKKRRIVFVQKFK